MAPFHITPLVTPLGHAGLSTGVRPFWPTGIPNHRCGTKDVRDGGLWHHSLWQTRPNFLRETPDRARMWLRHKGPSTIPTHFPTCPTAARNSEISLPQGVSCHPNSLGTSRFHPVHHICIQRFQPCRHIAIPHPWEVGIRWPFCPSAHSIRPHPQRSIPAGRIGPTTCCRNEWHPARIH